MQRRLVFATLCLASAGAAAQASLTGTEMRWLRAAAPVLSYARELALPVDIIVQPQAGPNDVPFAMGFDGGRCKLVLSMRGNARAEDILAALAPEQRALMIEVMAAHELGHCWRYAGGAWHVLPKGFVEPVRQSGLDPELLRLSEEIQATRREEGFADLAALAWVRWRHPEQYRQVYGWLDSVRHDGPVAGGSHDTGAWRRLAADGAAFGAPGNPFEQAFPLWRRGLNGKD